jgi:hypothetical protein
MVIGKRVDDGLDHWLQPAAQVLPITPQDMTKGYVYRAGAPLS